MTEGKKQCPICGEKIKSVAKKCIHCGEFIEPPAETEYKTPCPKCRELVRSGATKCIHCGEFISTSDGRSGWWRGSFAEIRGDKTLWDIVSLIFVPIVLAGLAFGLNQCASQRQQKDRNAQATLEAEVEKDRFEEATLQTYLDHMSELMLKENLRTSEEDDEVTAVARARTLTALRELDGTRKGLLVKFLKESELINKDKPIVDLRDADLVGADLYGADLSGVDLSGAILSEANLYGADLEWASLIGARLYEARLFGANLTYADLREASLRRADLREAFLKGADLTDAEVTTFQLDLAMSLEGATMPDGTKHE